MSNKSKPSPRGTVEPYLLSEFHPLPAHSKQFDHRHYRYAGVSWPLQEFEGLFQMYRHARLCKHLERRFTSGDALIVRYYDANLITTLVPLERRAPILHNGEMHRVFEGDAGDCVLLQLPESFRLSQVSVTD